jgi:hypothetical protein
MEWLHPIKDGEIAMTVKELMNFLSKQNPDAKVTLTKDVADVYTDKDNSYEEAYYKDEVIDLDPYCLTVDVLGDGDVDIRWI